MKSLAAIGFVTIMTLQCAAQEEDPFAADPQPDPPRPERKIKKLPNSVTYEEEDKAHTYTINGIYKGAGEDNDVSSTYKVFVPECTSLKLNFNAGTCTIVTSRKLTLSELAYSIDDLARLGGDLPYWQELEARDIERSGAFHPKRFTTEKLDGEFPAGLAWFWVPKDRDLTTSFNWTQFEQGNLLIVPKTAHCMAHSRFAIRILDRDGKLVWQDTDTALAAVRFAIADTDQDGAHEIYIDRDDHGEETRFHIKQTSESGSRESLVPGPHTTGHTGP